MFCLFLTYHGATADLRVTDSELRALCASLRGVSGLVRAEVLTPAQAADRYYDDGPGPMLMIQAWFAHLSPLEQAIGPGGALAGLTGENFASLAQSRGQHQVMWARQFPVPAPARPQAPTSQNESRCAYMVHYHGEPEDAGAWHRFYLDHHPAIMARFPDIREIEVYTPVEWIDALPWPRARFFQRNRVVFDDPGALETALHSPVREAMKADRESFPAFVGGSVHVPMTCWPVLPDQA